jgi:lipopolysaccharide/colanic/teichoic acid biosynthesis glycosyltransferase
MNCARNKLAIPTLSAKKRSRLQSRVKRLMDLIGATSALVLLSPVLASVAILVYVLDGKPILYRWCVVGKGGVPFTSWKFRTMARDADALKPALLALNEMSGPVFKLRDDPRVTRLGRTLRQFSLDELPQLWSVLKGDMSLVGPRPPLIKEYEQFSDWQREKLSVTPGMTCLWQISGRNEITDFNEWVRMDLQYIQQWSIIGDLKIILRTFGAVLCRRGAY